MRDGQVTSEQGGNGNEQRKTGCGGPAPAAAARLFSLRRPVPPLHLGKIRHGLEDVEAGRVKTQEDVEAHFAKWLSD